MIGLYPKTPFFSGRFAPVQTSQPFLFVDKIPSQLNLRTQSISWYSQNNFNHSLVLSCCHTWVFFICCWHKTKFQRQRRNEEITKRIAPQKHTIWCQIPTTWHCVAQQQIKTTPCLSSNCLWICRCPIPDGSKINLHLNQCSHPGWLGPPQAPLENTYFDPRLPCQSPFAQLAKILILITFFR